MESSTSHTEPTVQGKKEATLNGESKRPRKRKYAPIFYKPLPEEKELDELVQERSHCLTESSSISSKLKKINSRLVFLDLKIRAGHIRSCTTGLFICSNLFSQTQI